MKEFKVLLTNRKSECYQELGAQRLCFPDENGGET